MKSLLILFCLLFSLNSYSVKRVDTYGSSVFKLQGAINVIRHGRLVTIGYTSGTGFSVNIKGKNYIMSNSHVCGDFTYMIARSKLGTFFVRVLKTANKPDLCLLEGVRFSRAIPFANKAPTVGSNTISIGHPAGGKKKISWGKYKGKQRLHIPALRRVECDNYNGTICWWIFDTMHSTSYTIGGSSGSPLMNDKGELIGVIFAGDKRDDGYAIPLDQVNGFISDL